MVVTKEAISVDELDVDDESYCTVDFNIRLVVSVSTITGVIDATLYGLTADTKVDYCTEVKFCPVVDLIEIKTLPYSGLELTTVLES